MNDHIKKENIYEIVSRWRTRPFVLERKFKVVYLLVHYDPIINAQRGVLEISWFEGIQERMQENG